MHPSTPPPARHHSSPTSSIPSIAPTPPLPPRHQDTSPSQSLEDLHYSLAQEISRAMLCNNPLPMLSTPPSHQSPNTIYTPLQTLPQRQTSPRFTTRAPITKPSKNEDNLIRKIHRKVGGPSKLSTYDDPAKVRHVVIEALADEADNESDKARIRKGQLTVAERRVVRTVTNRGAAVRSRMRQRREVASLKNELMLREKRVRELEGVVRMLCHRFGCRVPEEVEGGSSEGETVAEVDCNKVINTSGTTLIQGPGNVSNTVPLEQEIFGTIVDQMITQPPWC